MIDRADVRTPRQIVAAAKDDGLFVPRLHYPGRFVRTLRDCWKFAACDVQRFNAAVQAKVDIYSSPDPLSVMQSFADSFNDFAQRVQAVEVPVAESLMVEWQEAEVAHFLELEVEFLDWLKAQWSNAPLLDVETNNPPFYRITVGRMIDDIENGLSAELWSAVRQTGWQKSPSAFKLAAVPVLNVEEFPARYHMDELTA